MSPRSDPPPNLNSLTARINNVVAAQQRPLRGVQRVVANTVVGQMIPSSVVKGGTGIKLRAGEWLSRFTPDFDLSRPAAVDVGSDIEGLQEAQQRKDGAGSLARSKKWRACILMASLSPM